MKIAIISDIHANYTALQAVYDDARSQGVSQIYCLGDLVGYHPQIDEVMEFVIDRNISITNVCEAACKFCAFHVPPGARGS